MRTTNELMASRTWPALAMSSSVPPTIEMSSPVAAAEGPPETPQSTTATPAAAADAATLARAAGEMVLTITSTVPGAAALRTPSSPLVTLRTWASLTTATTTTSHCAASSAGLEVVVAWSAKAASGSSRTSHTTSGSPAPAHDAATPRPMSPSPITPTRVGPCPVMVLPRWSTLPERRSDAEPPRWTRVQTVV